MGRTERDPADHDSWEAWQESRERDGKMPVIARSVAYAIPAVLIVLALTWLVLDRIGATLDDDVIRTGTAVIAEDCRPATAGFRCPARVSWADGENAEAVVRSTEPVSGTVEVQERSAFQSQRRGVGNVSQAWAADHTPDARPWLFPVVYGVVGVLSLGIAGVWIAKGSQRFERRSRQRWARARVAAGKSC